MSYTLKTMRLLQKTSLSFLASAIFCGLYNQWTCAAINTCLGITSICNHTKYTRTTLAVDRIMIGVFTFQIIRISYSQYITSIPVLLGYMYVFYCYIYGYYKKCGSFDICKSKGDKYHAVMHIIAPLIYSTVIILNDAVYS